MNYDYGLKIGNQSNLSPLYGDPGMGANDLKIGNVALNPEVDKKVKKFKPGLMRNQYRQGLQSIAGGTGNLFPGAMDNLGKKLGMSTDEILKPQNAKDLLDKIKW